MFEGSLDSLASLVAQLVKNPPAMQETPVQFLDREDPLEEDMATHSSILAWRVPVDRGASWATVHGVTKSQTWLSHLAHTHSHMLKIFYNRESFKKNFLIIWICKEKASIFLPLAKIHLKHAVRFSSKYGFS